MIVMSNKQYHKNWEVNPEPSKLNTIGINLMSIYPVNSLLISHNNSHAVLLPRNLTSKWIQFNEMSSLTEQECSGSPEKEPLTSVAMCSGGYVHEFGIRKGQVQILIQIETSCVELKEVI